MLSEVDCKKCGEFRMHGRECKKESDPATPPVPPCVDAHTAEEIAKLNKCSYIGPMRDCPTHGESEKLKAAKQRIVQLEAQIAESLRASLTEGGAQ